LGFQLEGVTSNENSVYLEIADVSNEILGRRKSLDQSWMGQICPGGISMGFAIPIH
jgi:hypothetical protein